jgi:hypothetical protein
MGPQHNYRDKLWLWKQGYDPLNEPTPDLTLEAVRLDGDASTFRIDGATNAWGDGWSAMLTGLEFPASGCWQVNAHYGKQLLTFVLRVGDTAAATR